MDVYRVSFFGHRTLYHSVAIEKEIERIVRELISTKSFVEFYVGRNGDYDICVASVIKRVQNAVGHHNSALILVLPYKLKDVEDYQKYYDDVILPLEDSTHFKAAITKRNRWMVDNSDLVLAYVERETGGAYQALRYAEKSGVHIINLGKRRDSDGV